MLRILQRVSGRTSEGIDFIGQIINVGKLCTIKLNKGHIIQVPYKDLQAVDNPPNVKKGDRVTGRRKDGSTFFGRCVKGGKNCTVVLDGGDFEILAPQYFFTVSDEPMQKDPTNPMTGYTLRKYKTLGGAETVCFTAEIVTPQGQVIFASNQGGGGPNQYHDNHGQKPTNAFTKNAAAWGKQFSCPFDFEVADLWVTYAVTAKQYNITSQRYMEIMGEECSESLAAQ